MSIWVVFKAVWRAKQHLNWFQMDYNIFDWAYIERQSLQPQNGVSK